MLTWHLMPDPTGSLGVVIPSHNWEWITDQNPTIQTLKFHDLSIWKFDTQAFTRKSILQVQILDRLVQVLGCSMDSKYSKWINSPPSYHSPKPSLRTHLSLNFSKTWNQFYMNCRNTNSLPSNSRNSPLQWLLNEK